jgi:uncharacterized protein
MFIRHYKLNTHILTESFFLFGPRQTGKTTELLAKFPKALFIDLLRPGVARSLESKPEELTEMIDSYLAKEISNPIVVIDEIQKLPILLDVVQSLIFKLESEGVSIRFILTGSSPRKLLKAGQNLLGGRIGWHSFWPLTFAEAKSDEKVSLTLKDMVQWGGLPAVLKSGQKKALLKRYVDVYLELEIKSEGVSRNLPKFSRFLEVAALSVGQQVSMRAISSDIGVSESTVSSWFGILEDTLVGHLVPCFQKTTSRKAMTSNKFYYFDCGVANTILGRFSLSEATPEFGVALESYVFQNLATYCSQNQEKSMKLFYWRSVDHEEVDFVITTEKLPIWIIEVKSGERLKEKDFSGLNAFALDFPNIRKTIVARVAQARKRSDGIEVVPVEEFLAILHSSSI